MRLDDRSLVMDRLSLRSVLAVHPTGCWQSFVLRVVGSGALDRSFLLVGSAVPAVTKRVPPAFKVRG